jgi:SchA/CurD like domain
VGTWSGLIYPLKPGTEETVADIFRRSGRPNHDVLDDDGNVVGRLIRTLVFVGPGLAIRVIEVDGDLRSVSRHMSRQPQVRAFEREIEQHLAVPRDMVTPEGAERFFRDAGMRPIAFWER